jgi:hypothetical protein
MHPELEFATRESEQDVINLENALIKAWDALPNSLFDSLVRSIERRVKACCKAKGWHTKY